MTSRQTAYHRRIDLAQLRHCADRLPLIVSVDEDRGPYIVSTLSGDRLIGGRYAIAYAFIAGFQAARDAGNA